jgi:GNAT superfamily N-acetyltransferase
MLRSAIPADAVAISTLLRDAFQQFRPRYTPQAFAATVLEPSGVIARLAEGPLWVFEREGRIVGTAGLRECMIRGMAVHPNARGLGIGADLLAEIERFAVAAGCASLALYTTRFLTSAVALYERSGFRFTGEVIAPHGTELVRMEKGCSSSR